MKMTFDERWYIFQDDCWWKTTFDGRRPLVEDKILLKTNLEGGRHFTFDGGGPLMEDSKEDALLPLFEEDLWWKMTFDIIHPLIEENL